MKDFIVLSKIGRYALPGYKSLDQSQIKINSLTSLCLGEGAYSEVYKVKRISDGNVYALKKVKMGKLSTKEKENALNEVRILASIR